MRTDFSCRFEGRYPQSLDVSPEIDHGALMSRARSSARPALIPDRGQRHQTERYRHSASFIPAEDRLETAGRGASRLHLLPMSARRWLKTIKLRHDPASRCRGIYWLPAEPSGTHIALANDADRHIEHGTQQGDGKRDDLLRERKTSKLF